MVDSIAEAHIQKLQARINRALEASTMVEVRAALLGIPAPAPDTTPTDRSSVDPKHGVLCSTDFTTGECRSMHCTRCGEPCGSQGHAQCFPELFTTPPDRSGRFVGDEFYPLTDLDGWQPAHEEAVSGD